MKRHLLLSTICATGLLCNALAQQSGSTSARSAQAASTTVQTNLQHIRLSHLLGANVKSSDGQSLGEIEDVVLNVNTRQIDFAIVGKGGFLGMGEKRVPVPWQSVSVSRTPDEGLLGKPNLVVNLDRKKLEGAPTMQKDKQFSELNQPDYIISVYRFYEIEPVQAGATGSQSGTQTGTQSGTQTNSQEKAKSKE